MLQGKVDRSSTSRFQYIIYTFYCRFLRLAMASIMDILKIKPFVEVSVGQLLWGYEDPLLKLAKDVVPKEQKLPYEEFGLMYGKNGTSAVSKLYTSQVYIFILINFFFLY